VKTPLDDARGVGIIEEGEVVDDGTGEQRREEGAGVRRASSSIDLLFLLFILPSGGGGESVDED
jgi:hypothetical protein